ncbi:DUF4221 family protein [Roseivirga echinicomitans]|nr:DUF4221 family protein [Roseivirga echinicomitans]
MAKLCTVVLGQTAQFNHEVFEKVIDLKLDSETAMPWYFGSVFQYCDDTGLLAYWNRVTRSIKYFDFESGETVKETKLSSYGPEEIPGEPYYFYYHNKDSVFVFSEFQSSKLFMVNDKGRKIDVFDFESKDGYRFTPFPRLTRVSGAIVVHKEHFFLSFNISEQKERNRVAPVLKYNMVTREYGFLEAPAAYGNMDLSRIPKGAQQEFYESRLAFNAENNEMVINYPLNQNLYLLRDGKVKEVEAKSESVEGFELLSRDKNRFEIDDIGYKKIVFGSARYFGVFYDQNNKLFYRLAKLDNVSKTESKYLSNSKKYVPDSYSWMLFDSGLSKKTEVLFSSREATPEKGVFLSPEGLWVLLPNNKGEDIMSIGLLKFNK